MSSFSWLLVSDLHLKSNYTTWSQNVVLRDMVRDIEIRKADYQNISFVIVSGDLAHGGKPAQYKLVEKFLDDLIAVLSLSRSDVFLVPGNHDIDRDICELTFHGTRSEFVNAENVEKYLSNAHERNTLLKRLSAYRKFERRYSKDLSRTMTDDGLAYFSERTIGNIPIGIIGLNSALACGNDADEQKIILGDRPIIDVCEILRTRDVRLTIGVLHHPPFWLRGFDQRTFDARFLPMCDILHRGHLHEEEVKLLYTGSSPPCLAIAAGAGYVWRKFDNSYSIVSFDSSAAECTASYFEYNNHSGKFDRKRTETQTVRLRGNIPGGAPEICDAIREFGGSAQRCAPLLAALISEQITEVPVPLNGRVFFAAAGVASATDGGFSKTLRDFLNVRNSLLGFASTTSLKDRVASCEGEIRQFADAIEAFANKDDIFSQDIDRRLNIVSEFCSITPQPRENNLIASMKQFVAEGDWVGLEIIARRYFTNESPEVKHSAQQHLCLALANSYDPSKLEEAVRIAEELVSRTDAVVDDFHLCFSVNRNQGHIERAEKAIRDAIVRFNVLPSAFAEGAIRFSVETSNATIRTLLNAGNGTKNE